MRTSHRHGLPLAVFAVLLASATAPAADQKAIDAAVRAGGEFLRKTFDPATVKNWTDPHGGAVAPLCGLALLEAGVKPDDPSVAAVTEFVRANAARQTATYNVALFAIYLDRLGEAKDVPLIQLLGVRLYAGMTGAGGWTYQTWQETTADEADRLLKALSTGGADRDLRTHPDKDKGRDDGFLKPTAAPSATAKLHPEVAKLYRTVRETVAARGRGGLGDDNSNTQFGLVGLWVTAKHGVPTADAFALVEERFLRTQSAADAGWAYTTVPGGSSSTPAMTCAGLLGLAVGAGSRDAAAADREAREAAKAGPPKKGDEGDPFFDPKAVPAAEKEKKKGTTARDRAVEAALTALGQFLGGAGRNGVGNFVGIGNSYYLLWSLERVGTAYSLDTVGGVDWYEYGCGVILPAQGRNGAWPQENYTPEINTAFAILFLTKANFVRDLSGKIKGKKDPGRAVLRAGGDAATPLYAPPPKGGAGGSKKPATADIPVVAGGFTLPEVTQPTEEGEIQKVAEALTLANDADWAGKLAEARDAKGSKWTRGLTLACARLDADRRGQARDALAERLVRMTPKTLREMVRDAEPELRRAACLACAMRDEKAFVPVLIDRLNDPSDAVVRAAHAGLKSLAGVDFGPSRNADDDARQKAVAAWVAWYEANQPK